MFNHHFGGHAPVKQVFLGLLLFLSISVSAPALDAEWDEGFTRDIIPEEQIDPDIRAFFSSFNQAIINQDVEAVAALFDPDAMLDHIASVNPVLLIDDEDRRTFRNLVIPNVAGYFCQPELGMSWQRMTYQSIKHIEPGHRVAVTVRQWDIEGISTRTAYYLIRHDTAWKIFDLNELDFGIPCSQQFAPIFLEGQFTDAQKQAHVTLMGGLLSTAQGDLQLAEQQFDAIKRSDLFANLRPILDYGQAAILAENSEFESAMTALDRAIADGFTDFPLVYYLRAYCHYALDRPDEAIAEAKRYAQIAGVDADILVIVGDARMLKGEWEAGLQAYRDALDDDPQHYEALLYFMHYLDDENKHEFRGRYQAVNNRTEVGAMLADDLTLLEDPAAVAALCEMHRELHPEDVWPAEYE